MKNRNLWSLVVLNLNTQVYGFLHTSHRDQKKDRTEQYILLDTTKTKHKQTQKLHHRYTVWHTSHRSLLEKKLVQYDGECDRKAPGDVRHKRGAKTVAGQRRRLAGRRSLMVVCAVIGALDVNPTDPLDSISLLVLVQMMRTSCSAPCCLQQGIVWTPSIMWLVQQDVEGLLIDPGLRELNLASTDQTYLNALLWHIFT